MFDFYQPLIIASKRLHYKFYCLILATVQCFRIVITKILMCGHNAPDVQY